LFVGKHRTSERGKTPPPRTPAPIKCAAGSAAGSLGRVAVWTPTFFAAFLGHFDIGPRCNRTGAVATADLSGVVLQPGQTKTVRIPAVPAPTGAPAGTTHLAIVEADSDCGNPYYLEGQPGTAYQAFEVVG
jgi:hypothetical protein